MVLFSRYFCKLWSQQFICEGVVGFWTSLRHSPLPLYQWGWPVTSPFSSFCVPKLGFSISWNTFLTLFQTLFACLRVCTCRPFADAPPVSCAKVIWKVLRWFYRIVFRSLSVSSYEVMRFTVFLRLSDNLRYRVFSDVTLAYVNAARSYYGLTRVSNLCFNPLRRSLLVVIVIDVWRFGHARLVCVNMFSPRWRWVCVSIVCVAPFARSGSAFGRLIFVLDDSFFVFNGDSSLVSTNARAV